MAELKHTNVPAVPTGTNRRAFIAGLPLAGAAPTLPAEATAAHPVHDPLVSLVAEWKRVHKASDDAAVKPGAGNFDTPEYPAIETQRSFLSSAIKALPPVSMEGVQAALELMWIDEAGDFARIRHIVAEMGQFRSVMVAMAGLTGGAV